MNAVAIILAATVSAATFTNTTTGAVSIHIPCAKVTRGDRMYVYFRVEKDMLEVGEELALRWIPPLGGACVGSTLTARNLGEKVAYRTWRHPELDPCAGEWGFAFTTRRIDSKVVTATVLTATVQPGVRQ